MCFRRELLMSFIGSIIDVTGFNMQMRLHNHFFIPMTLSSLSHALNSKV